MFLTRKKKLEYQRNWYLKNRSRLILKQRKWRSENREIHRAYSKNWEKQNKGKRLIIVRRARKKLSNAVIEKYGGICKCCGEKHREFLVIDHINGGGTKIMKEIKDWYKLRRQMLKIYDSNLRVLCANCNMALAIYGYCPHKK